VHRVSENVECKMPIDNLATVFGPTVVGYSRAEPTMNDIMVQTKLQQLVRVFVLYTPRVDDVVTFQSYILSIKILS